MILFKHVKFNTCVGLNENATESDYEWYSSKVATLKTDIFLNTRLHVLRLVPGEDFLDSIWKYARVTGIKAASLLTVVGSLTQTNIRYANQEAGTAMYGYFEIVSAVGTIDFQNTTDSGHIHISVANENGATFGGHALSGNKVYTTAEITILEATGGIFERELDNGKDGSGYYELTIYRDNN